MRLRGAIAIAGLSMTAWTGGLSSASADPVAEPVLPIGPAVPLPAEGAAPVAPAPSQPAPAAAQSMLGQAAAALGQSNPLTAMADLLADSPQPALLGLAPLPPETISNGPAPDPIALAQLLKPTNYRMPTEDQISPYALAPNTNPSPFARIDAWKGVHAMVHSSIGRMPGAELGQPLPGTAPPPGSNIPPGLEQFYIPPADPLLVPPPSPVG